MKKVVTILGARPQFIKASVVSLAMAELSSLTEVVVHTGQHFDSNMSDIFFEQLGLSKPDYFLNINGVGHGAMTGRMLTEIESVLIRERPDAVLVYGDTNSTLAGALAAVKLQIPVAHVEAGLRSFNMAMPEEINRILTDRISRWLFTPTEAAAAHLRREGFPEEYILPVGDVMLDVAIHFGEKVIAGAGVLAQLDLMPKSYILATIHRAENTDHLQRLATIVDALALVSEETPVVWPLHPRTRGILKSSGMLNRLPSGVKLLDPVGYLDMVQLEKFASVVATDSGGVQKEAFFHKVPCVTLRDETEWTELVTAGWNKLAPPTNASQVSNTIINAVHSIGADIAPYGNGKSAKLIAKQICGDLF